jgi:ketosteroid isomerase-like protein
LHHRAAGLNETEDEKTTPDESRNVSVVLAYFEGCNSGELDALLSALDPDVVHNFLPARFPPIRGAEHLAKYWRKFKNLLDPIWRIDHIVGRGDEVVSEWSCLWTPEGTSRRVMMRGTEWYVMRNARIAEVRAYFLFDDTGDSQLTGFPYMERGYLESPQ